jgi:hypothetical protein
MNFRISVLAASAGYDTGLQIKTNQSNTSVTINIPSLKFISLSVRKIK